MAGEISALRGMTPDRVTNKEVVSYEVSTLFGRGAFQQRYNPDLLASRKGLGIYASMLHDEQVKAVMNFRRGSITSRGWEFTYPDDSPLAEDERANRIAFFKHNVQTLRGSFQDALNAIMRGHVFGFSLTEKVFDVVQFDGRPMQGVVQLLARDPVWFTFYTDAYGTLEKVEQRIGNQVIEIDVAKFVHYVCSPEIDRYYGESDLRAGYRPWYIKDVVIKLYATYLERFAGGFAVTSIGVDSSLTANSTEYIKLKEATDNIRNLASILLPPGVTTEVVMPSNTGEYREALTYFDLAIAKSVLVPNLLGLSHAGQTGAYSQSQTQLEAYFMTIANDTARLEDVLNEQLFRNLGDLNWNDGQYPRFTFKPASAEHIKWIISTWKDLVGAKAVQTTLEDEDHLRELLEMPARMEEDEDPDAVLKSDPGAAFSGIQITAMLEVLKAVATGDLPKEAAVHVLLASYPMSEEEVRALVEPIEEGSLKPPPPTLMPPGAVPGAKQPANGAEPPVKMGKHDHPRSVPPVVFSRAIARVEFALIEKRTETVSEDAVEAQARLAARAVRRALSDEKLSTLLDEDVEDIGEFAFDRSDVGKLKAGFKDALARAWEAGQESASRELGKAKRPVKFATSLRDIAASFFESNGFRMAQNLTDGMRSIIQQELLNAVKTGLRPEEVMPKIYERLIHKGFTTWSAVQREELRKEAVNGTASLLESVPNIPAYLNTLVRTNTFEALNEARFAAFEDPDLEGFTVAYEYSAIMDDSTTEICQSLDNSIFSQGSEVWDQYRPPNHFNCRSVLIPIFATDEWDGIESPPPTVEPQDGFK